VKELKKMKVFEGLLSEGYEESCKAKVWNSKTGDSENFIVEVLQDDAVS
jgi:hypothetical protein